MFNFLGGWAETRDNVVTMANQRADSAVASSSVVSTTEQEEDELANELLVQFPVYGTRSQAQTNNLNPTADWLLGGTANIPSQQQLLL